MQFNLHKLLFPGDQKLHEENKYFCRICYATESFCFHEMTKKCKPFHLAAIVFKHRLSQR